MSDGLPWDGIEKPDWLPE